MNFGELLLVGACAAGAMTWTLTLALRRSSHQLGLIDIPNARSSHRLPVPRAGGLSFVLVAPTIGVATLLLSGTCAPAGAGRLLVAALVVAAFSLADDRYGMPAGLKLIVHLIAAIAVADAGLILRDIALPDGSVLSMGWAALPATVLWIVGLTNAYNFMDGIDGLAGGQAVVTLVVIALLSDVQGDHAGLLAAVILGASVVGFLAHNWPPARIFMGDVGSAFLGFTFASWSLLPACSARSALPFLPWVAVMAPFLLDTGTTLIARAARREPLHMAHRQHLYQRLVDGGWSHRVVTLFYLGVALALGLLSVKAYDL